MCIQVDHFCNLRDRLDAIEDRVQAVKTRLLSPPECESLLRDRLAEARTKLHWRIKRIVRAVANMNARAEDKVAEVGQSVKKWQAERELQWLNARRQRAEAYASDAVEFAAATIEEAEAAILDAVVARLDASATR